MLPVLQRLAQEEIGPIDRGQQWSFEVNYLDEEKN
jgi:hypothetical protein